MTDAKFKMSIGRTRATGIILEKELSTDEVYQVINVYQKEIERLEQFRDNVFDLINKKIEEYKDDVNCDGARFGEYFMDRLNELKEELKEYD